MVCDSLGFNKQRLSKGIAVFSGQSSMKKTLTAEIIAGELNIDLYKIDSSAIISKYIGETEKNLDRIFRDAENNNMLLFFDEADALFGKRNKVKDSHDQYAKIESNFIFKKIEAHKGIVIFATNVSKNIPNAFVSQINFIVEFPEKSVNEKGKV